MTEDFETEDHSDILPQELVLPQGPDPEEFANSFCVLKLNADDNACRVSVACKTIGLDGQPVIVQKSKDIGPLLDRLALAFLHRHSQHGRTASGAVCAGWFDDVVAKVRSAATSHAVNDLLADSTVRTAVSVLPYGSAAIVVADQLNHIVGDAKKGDPGAKARLQALKDQADAGSPEAKQALALAKKIAVAQKVKAKRTNFYDRGVGVGHDPLTVGAVPPPRSSSVRVTNTQPGGGRGAQTDFSYVTRQSPGGASVTEHRQSAMAAYNAGNQRQNAAYLQSLQAWGSKDSTDAARARLVDNEGANFIRPTTFLDPGTAQGLPPPQPDPYGGYPDPQDPNGYPPGYDPYGLYGQPDPYGLGGGYSQPAQDWFPDLGQFDPYAYGPNPWDADPVATQAQVYDPATDSFYAQASTPQGLPQQYDPDTDSFSPVLAINPYTNKVVAGGDLDAQIQGWMYSRPYRKVLAAALDRSPAHPHRSLYSKGIAA